MPSFDDVPNTWELETTHWNDLSGSDKVRYSEIVASYGGGEERQTARFRRYRAAELCAYSIRNVLGVETRLGLVMPHGT